MSDENSQQNIDLRKRLFESVLLSKSNPQRPPDWRWKLAEKLLQDSPQGVVPNSDDEYVQQAIRLKLIVDLKYQDFNTIESRIQALQQFPQDYVNAYFLKFSADPNERGIITRNVLQQAYLEGLVLAGKSRQKIAKLFNVSEAVIEVYENWWFDVRDRLSSKAWVVTQVIGKLYDRNLASLLPAFIRACGYHTKKASIVHSVVSLFDEQISRGTLNQEMFFMRDKVFTLGIKSAISAKFFGLDAEMFDVVMRAHDDAINTLLQSGQIGQDEAEKQEDMFRIKILKKGLQSKQPKELPPVELSAEDIEKTETELFGEDFNPTLSQ